MSESSLSRRQLFPALVGGIAVAAAASLDVSEPAWAQPKVSKQTAKYQDNANIGNKCSICQYFQPPKSSQLDDGDISPDG